MSARMNAFCEPPPALPSHIGKYAVSQRIGSGAMGVVYRAVDPDLQRPVAIKTIRPQWLADGAEDGAAARRFRLEAQAAGRLSHPNIVSVYEYGQSPEGLYIAMECVDGRPLRALLDGGRRLPIEDVMAVMLQLLDALRCAHQQHVWHCDIKPANLLLTRDGVLKVSDFGIARLDGGDAFPRGAIYGSPGYIAPERCRGEEPDQRADLFACGVLLYELLTGVSPFCGDAKTALHQLLHDDPPPPSGLHGDRSLAPLDVVVARAIAKDPSARFTSAADMRIALLAAAPLDRVRQVLSPAALMQMRRAGAPAEAPPRPASQGFAPTQVVARGMSPSQRSRSAPATAPATAPTITAPHPGEPDALSRLEALLRPLLGPMARVVVRDAARRAADLPGMVAHIADHALQAEERPVFLRRAARIAAAAGAPLPGERPPADGAMPVLGETPLTPDDVTHAARLLAAEIGPLAMLLARRAAAASTSCEQFFCTLAGQADGVDRRVLLDRFWQGRARRPA